MKYWTSKKERKRSQESRKIDKISCRQLKMMVSMMEVNSDLADGKLTFNLTKDDRQRKWNEISKLLNNHEDGAVKSGDKWRRYWDIKKSIVRTKMAAVERRRQLFGICPDLAEILSPIEERILNIIECASAVDNNAVKKENVSDVDIIQPILPSIKKTVLSTTESVIHNNQQIIMDFHESSDENEEILSDQMYHEPGKSNLLGSILQKPNIHNIQQVVKDFQEGSDQNEEALSNKIPHKPCNGCVPICGLKNPVVILERIIHNNQQIVTDFQESPDQNGETFSNQMPSESDILISALKHTDVYHNQLVVIDFHDRSDLCEKIFPREMPDKPCESDVQISTLKEPTIHNNQEVQDFQVSSDQNEGSLSSEMCHEPCERDVPINGLKKKQKLCKKRSFDENSTTDAFLKLIDIQTKAFSTIAAAVDEQTVAIKDLVSILKKKFQD